MSAESPRSAGRESMRDSAPRYSRDVVAQVLAANDIVDVIGACLDLKPSGSNRFVALCPFHKEKTPSFSVNRERQMFYCFGCEKGGDAIAFLCDYEGVVFVEALRKLADRAGIRLPAPSGRSDKEESLRHQLFEAGIFAQRFFARNLEDPLKGGRARSHLRARALKPDTVKRFALGYAPDDWRALIGAAREAGIHDRVLESAGLAKRAEGKDPYDFFRDRLMFPIRDVSGNVVAFGGRDLGGEASAKYINTSENSVYKKSRVLYGLHETREALRREKQAVLVEGYFDLLRCFDVGIQNVVATCGTALTDQQAALIRRYVSEVVVVYDGDPAGVRAALRGIAILTGAGLTVRALALPVGQDPDDYIREQGVEAFRSLMDAAPDFVAFYARMNGDRLTSIEGRTEVAKEIFAILLAIDDELRRDEYLKRTARELELHEWAVRKEFQVFLRTGRSRDARISSEEEAPVTLKMSEDDREFLSVLLVNEPMRERAKELLATVTLSPSPLVEVLGALFDDPKADVAGRLSSDGARALYAAASNTPALVSERAESLVQKRVTRLKKDALLVEAGRLQEAIKEAERQDDGAKVTELISRKIGINREIEEVGTT